MFEKIRGRIRDWWKPASQETDSTPQIFTPKAHPLEQLERPSQRQITTSTRTRWITFGLNRKERRAREKQLQMLTVAHPKTKKLVPRSPKYTFRVDLLKWELKNSPHNYPSNGGSNNPIFEGRI